MVIRLIFLRTITILLSCSGASELLSQEDNAKDVYVNGTKGRFEFDYKNFQFLGKPTDNLGNTLLLE